MFSKGNNDEHEMHSRKNSIELIINDKENEVKEELFQSLLSRYQILLQKSLKNSDFIFVCINFV